MGLAAVVATTASSPSRATKTLPSRNATSSWVSVRPAPAGAAAATSSSWRALPTSRAASASSANVEARTDPSARNAAAVSICDEIFGQIGERGRGLHVVEPNSLREAAHTAPDAQAVRPQPLAKFFADRGTHLAAMIAYFGCSLRTA